MRVLGVDPGKKGGLAVAERDRVVLCEAMPDHPAELAHLIKHWELTHAYVEKSQAMPHGGVSSTFNYGVSTGEIHGILYALEIPLRLVPPREWTKEIHRGVTGQNAKTKSKKAARNLFPYLNFEGKRGGFLDGLADAALIAEFARREILGSKNG